MMGKQDVMFAGGAEELDWTLSCLFDAMGAMSSHFNDDPDTRLARLRRRPRRLRHRRRRRHRGAGGARARARPAAPRSTPRSRASPPPRTAHDMVAPSGEGGERAMRLALRDAAAGPPGQLHQRPRHLDAGRRRGRGDGGAPGLRRGTHPPISSTKSMTGHSQGATGAQEAIYCLLMLRDDFIAPSINVETLDPALAPGRDRHRARRRRRARHGDDQLASASAARTARCSCQPALGLTDVRHDVARRASGPW